MTNTTNYQIGSACYKVSDDSWLVPTNEKYVHTVTTSEDVENFSKSVLPLLLSSNTQLPEYDWGSWADGLDNPWVVLIDPAK